MAAVTTLVFIGVAVWTGVSFAAALLLGRTVRRLQPVPVRASVRRVVDLRRVR